MFGRRAGSVRGQETTVHSQWSIGPLTPSPSPARGEGNRSFWGRRRFRAHGVKSLVAVTDRQKCAMSSAACSRSGSATISTGLCM